MRSRFRSSRTSAAPTVTVVLVGLLLAVAASSAAQVPPIGGSTPSPTASPPPATPRPTATPAASPGPTPTPTPGDPSVPDPLPSPTPGPGQTPEAPGDATPAPGTDEQDDEETAGQIPPGFEMPRVARTPGRNTTALVRILEQVTEAGIPLEQALLEGMGRFPVAGLAWYSDDWWLPRFVPYFHLHEGLDIFADFGTPIRAPDTGVVTRMVDGPIGGIALWMRGRDGTQYYFAHLEGWAGGMEVGRNVEVGTVIGYVGDSGNARGGPPHLHFEIHRPDAIPPKPMVDEWLAEAEAEAPAYVERKMRQVLARRALLRTEQSLSGSLSADRSEPSATPEYSVLLTLLDPVGGSVGLLPRLPLMSNDVPPPSDRLIQEFIRLRVDGALLPALMYGYGRGTG